MHMIQMSGIFTLVIENLSFRDIQEKSLELLLCNEQNNHLNNRRMLLGFQSLRISNVQTSTPLIVTKHALKNATLFTSFYQYAICQIL